MFTGIPNERQENNQAHSSAALNPKSRTKAGTFPKDDSRFWLSRVIHRHGSPNYGMRIEFRRRELTFSLRTGNKEAAAKRAAAIFRDLVELGVDATIKKHRGPKDDVPKREEVTIGAWVSAAEKVFDGSPATFGGYVRALRLIASQILATQKTTKRFGRTQSKNYRQQIDSTPLAIFTPTALQSWRIAYVKRVGENPAKRRSARISANSAIRQARALFSRKIVKFVSGVAAPDPLPFSGVEFFPRESMKYHSKIDPSALLRTAHDELLICEPEVFKALVLALGGGLRRGEIDKLLWRQLDFDAELIRIEATETGGLKTPDSAGVVPIDEGLVAILRGMKARSHGPFVLEGGTGMTVSLPWGQRYRCTDVFDRLTQWLRQHGVEGARPLHTLRKEAGSLVATEAGIHAASRFLRHADIQITAAYYADHKDRVPVRIGSLLEPQNVIALPKAAPDTATKAANKKASGP
jgi:integrase